MSELLKELTEKSLQTGRAFQSSQTGFVHYHHRLPLPAVHQTIPFYENSLFILALLRSHLVENVNEGKDLLGRVLCFQSEEGDFPFYLHDFPRFPGAQNSIRLIPPFYWILKDYGHILGKPLKLKLEKSLAALVRLTLLSHLKDPFPYSLEVLLMAGLQSAGKLLSEKEWSETGREGWRELAHMHDSWSSTSYLADLLIAHQMVEKEENSWASFWHYLSQTWHPVLHCYAGPCVREWQERGEPQPNAYDLFLGYFQGSFPKRTAAPGIYHLQGVLIQAVPHFFTPPLLPFQQSGLYKNQNWSQHCQTEYGWSLLEKKHDAGPVGEKMFTPFRLIAGSPDRLHTLVCQGGKFEREKFLESSQAVELFFYFDGSNEAEEREKSRDICFYLDDHPDWSILVNGLKGTIFELGQTVSFHLKDGLTLLLTFELVEGEGQFMGHAAKGNRPSQFQLVAEEKSFQAYDTVVFLRCVRRQAGCCIKATVRFK